MPSPQSCCSLSARRSNGSHGPVHPAHRRSRRTPDTRSHPCTRAREGPVHPTARLRRQTQAGLPSCDHPYDSSEDPDEPVVLVGDPARLEVPVKHESPEAGAEEVPQVYGPIPVDAVTGVEPWR
ncbi:DUF952 domain-containing protein [Streptomyces sp. NPDC017202]|uniref:DUF952 domain-containing protein n=1 Tax=Streptomyces sp. NPDC017202 TaxID=3364981 RepID=UPI0037983632